MFSVILCLAVLLLCSMGLGILFKRRPEECIPTLFLGIIVCLYVFYCLNILVIGKYVLYAALLFLLAFAGRKAVQKAKRGEPVFRLFLKKFFTPSVALFLFLAVLFLVFASLRKPAVWDELRLWAAMPKALHFSEALQVGEGSLLYSTMQSYPPGLSLLIYFFTSLSGTWHYGSTYAVCWIFYAALFLPGLRKIDWKRWFYAPLAIFLIVGGAIFLTLSGNEPSGDYAFFFGSYYIDPYIGCVLGYGLFRIVKKPFADAFSVMDFSFALFVLSSLKNVGALYAGILFAAAVLIRLTDRSGAKGGRIWLLVFPLLSAAVPYASWQWIIRRFGTGEFIDFNMAGFTAQKAGTVLKGLFSWGVIPFFYFVIFFLLAELLMTRFLKDIPRREAVVAMAALGVCVLLFLYGYTSHYGLMLSSIHRYTSTFTFACFVYLFSRCFSRIRKTEANAGGRVLLISFLLLFVTVFLLVRDSSKYFPNDSFSDAHAAKEAAKETADPSYSAKHPAKTYLALGGDTRKEAQRHETYALEFIGTPLNIQSIWCDKLFNEAEDGVITDQNEMTRIFADRLLQEGYAYVAVARPDADILYAVKQIAPNISLSEKDALCILKVTPSAGTYGVTLERP